MKVMVLIMSVALSAVANAGEIKETCIVTEQTNKWETAIALYELGEYPVASEWTYYLNTTATNHVYICGEYAWRPAKCDKTHFSDWPKSNDVVMAVQKLTIATLFRGTNKLTTTLHYAYPHRKITTTTTEWLIVQTNVVTRIEDVK